MIMQIYLILKNKYISKIFKKSKVKSKILKCWISQRSIHIFGYALDYKFHVLTLWYFIKNYL